MPTSLADRVRIVLMRMFFSTLAGMKFSDCWRFYKDNRFAIAPRHLFRAGFTLANSLGNSSAAAKERRLFGDEIEQAEIPPLVFILGHWRSGTTHLHNLLTLDSQFACPNFYQVTFPNGFLVTEKWLPKLMGFFLPSTRQLDAMSYGFQSPAEDEFALAHDSLISPYLWWAFPRDPTGYEEFLTLRIVSAEQLSAWKESLVRFLKKLSIKYESRTLILKSPTHTARLRLLAEMFPTAKFILIHRNPYEVFLSTHKMSRTIISFTKLQCYDPNIIDERTIRQYREMYDAYFDDRPAVDDGRLCEVAFTDLKKDPLGQIERIYEGVGLCGFDAMKPTLESYLASIADYRPNKHPDLPEETRTRLATEWARTFDEFGYST